MSRALVRFLVVGTACVLSAVSSSFADVTNSYHLDKIAIWDLSGHYTNDAPSLEYTLSQDGKGRVQGSGSAVYSNQDLYAEMDLRIKGHIKTHGRDTTLHFVLKTQGNVTYEGETYPFHVTGGYKADVQPGSKTLTGLMKAVVHFGDEKVYIHEPFTVDLPFGMDGSADLQTVLKETRNRIAGVAVLTLSNGVEMNFAVKGGFDHRKNKGKFHLKGIDAARGSRMVLITDSDNNLLSIKGRAMGQKIDM